MRIRVWTRLIICGFLCCPLVSQCGLHGIANMSNSPASSYKEWKGWSGYGNTISMAAVMTGFNKMRSGPLDDLEFTVNGMDADEPRNSYGQFGLILLNTIPNTSFSNEPFSVARVFSDHMVLQRDRPIPVWGSGKPGDQVKVYLGKAVETTKVDANGRWEVQMPVFEAGGPYEMEIQSMNDTIRFTDILIGDVWLASGQSNMNHPISGWDWIPHSEIDHAEDVLEDNNYPDIRLFSVPLYPSPAPIRDIPVGKWEKVDQKSLSGFSATSWFFAKRLNQELDIPIGIIHSSWGGTSILTWSDPKTLELFRDSFARQTPDEFNYDPNSWYSEMKVRLQKRYERRNLVSFPDTEVLNRVLSSDIGDNMWQTTNLSEGDPSSHVIWLRQDIELPPGSNSDRFELSLGFLNRQSNIYWNGRELGYFQYPGQTKVTIPSEWIRPGINALIIRLANPWQRPTVLGSDELFYLKSSTANIYIPIKNEWVIAEHLQPILPAEPTHLNDPGFLFNGMIFPLVPYGIKGFIWDQGAADASRPKFYAEIFQQFIRNRRNLWGDDRLPFLFIQNTSTYSDHDYDKSSYMRSYLREAQEKALELPETGMVVSIDLGDPYDVHPGNKQDFGERLALQALRKVYHKDVVADGPFYQSHYMTGDTVVIKLATESPLALSELKGVKNGFELLGLDGSFLPFEASVISDQVYISSPHLVKAKELRYAWGNYPTSTIFNADGLPLAPFRIKFSSLKKVD